LIQEAILGTATGSAILAMRPVRHGPQGPCSQGTLNMAFNTVIACWRGIQYSYSLLAWHSIQL